MLYQDLVRQMDIVLEYLFGAAQNTLEILVSSDKGFRVSDDKFWLVCLQHEINEREENFSWLELE